MRIGIRATSSDPKVRVDYLTLFLKDGTVATLDWLSSEHIYENGHYEMIGKEIEIEDIPYEEYNVSVFDPKNIEKIEVCARNYETEEMDNSFIISEMALFDRNGHYDDVDYSNLLISIERR